MIKFNYLFLPMIAALVVACSSAEEHELTEVDPINVQVAVAESKLASQSLKVSGRIEAVNSANVSTRMMGNISKVLVMPGDKVKKGDLLLVISSADLQAKKSQVQASIAQAESGLSNAQRDFERFTSLFEKGSASRKELENMTTRYEVAKAGLEAARQMEKEINAQFAYTNLRAPFSGIVTNTFAKAGDIANPGMPLATVEGTGTYEAVVMIPESKIGLINEGALTSVLVKSTNQRLDGKIKEISPSAKNTGGQFLAKIDLSDTQGILPGMYVNADIQVDQLGETNQSPVIQEEALIRRGQLKGIYTLTDDNKVILRWVRTGKEQDGQVEILAGLSAGERYITKAEGKLFNGATVLVNNKK